MHGLVVMHSSSLADNTHDMPQSLAESFPSFHTISLLAQSPCDMAALNSSPLLQALLEAARSQVWQGLFMKAFSHSGDCRHGSACQAWADWLTTAVAVAWRAWAISMAAMCAVQRQASHQGPAPLPPWPRQGASP